MGGGLLVGGLQKRGCSDDVAFKVECCFEVFGANRAVRRRSEKSVTFIVVRVTVVVSIGTVVVVVVVVEIVAVETVAFVVKAILGGCCVVSSVIVEVS